MDAKTRIEFSLERAISHIDVAKAPPKLAAAIRYAVFPGGARVRPKLCLAVASACGADDPDACTTAAISIELLHCASLVHDDLPCFDDAATRRGKPSVHKAFGVPLAVLAGDALIVLAFETLAMGLADVPQRLPFLLAALSRSVGMPHGIVAGQAWESEPHADLGDYQRAKTGSLFVAATMAGAAAAGANPDPWRILGERLGEAYQVADDICDVAYCGAELGKPIGQDAALGRPNTVAQIGIDGAVGLLKKLVAQASESIPPCSGIDALRSQVMLETLMVLPKELLQRAA
jgi:geranylgeranyl diphosphate synthase, type II